MRTGNTQTPSTFNTPGRSGLLACRAASSSSVSAGFASASAVASLDSANGLPHTILGFNHNRKTQGKKTSCFPSINFKNHQKDPKSIKAIKIDLSKFWIHQKATNKYTRLLGKSQGYRALPPHPMLLLPSRPDPSERLRHLHLLSPRRMASNLWPRPTNPTDPRSWERPCKRPRRRAPRLVEHPLYGAFWLIDGKQSPSS